MKSKNLRELKPEFLRLYNEEKKSIREIARIYNVDKTSISRYIHEDTKPRLRGLTDTQKEMAKTLYEGGHTLRGIAREINSSPSTVKTFLTKEYGEIRTSRKRKYEHLVDFFVNDYNAGLSSWEISKKYNVSPTTVLNYIEENYVKARNYSESSRKYEINENYFDFIDERKSYILGLILGSSCEYTKSSMDFIDIRISKKQNHLIDMILEDIYISDKPFKNSFRNTITIRVSSRNIVQRILEIKKQLISEQIPNELEKFKEYFLQGFIEVSKIDIKNGACIRIYKNNINFIKNLLNNYYTITECSTDLKNVFSSSENRKKLGLTFYKDYTIYKLNKNINSNFNKLSDILKFEENNYIVFFHKDNETMQSQCCKHEKAIFY